MSLKMSLKEYVLNTAKPEKALIILLYLKGLKIINMKMLKILPIET